MRIQAVCGHLTEDLSCRPYIRFYHEALFHKELHLRNAGAVNGRMQMLDILHIQEKYKKHVPYHDTSFLH